MQQHRFLCRAAVHAAAARGGGGDVLLVDGAVVEGWRASARRQALAAVAHVAGLSRVRSPGGASPTAGGGGVGAPPPHASDGGGVCAPRWAGRERSWPATRWSTPLRLCGGGEKRGRDRRRPPLPLERPLLPAAADAAAAAGAAAGAAAAAVNAGAARPLDGRAVGGRLCGAAGAPP